MFTVLFTSIGCRVELVQAFRRLSETHGIKTRILGTDANPSLAPASYFMDQCFKVPKVDAGDYVDFLLAVCKTEKVDLLIPLFEPEFSVLEVKRFEFEKLGVLLLLSEGKVLEICQDKWQAYQFFTTHKICQ